MLSPSAPPAENSPGALLSASAESSAAVDPLAPTTVNESVAPSTHSTIDSDRSTQVSSDAEPRRAGAPLQAMDSVVSITSTVPDTDGRLVSEPTLILEDSQGEGDFDFAMEATQPVEEQSQSADEFGRLIGQPTQSTDEPNTFPSDHVRLIQESKEPEPELPEHPPSPSAASTTHPPASIPDTSSGSGDADIPLSTVKSEEFSGKTPSANRLSISYAAGTRRMVIDAHVVEKLQVFRSDARIEVHMNITRDDGQFKGILVSLFICV